MHNGGGKMSKRINLYIRDEALWENFTKLVGKGNVSRWVENIIRPYVDNSELANSYKEMAQDKKREQDAREWVNGTFGDIGNEPW